MDVQINHQTKLTKKTHYDACVVFLPEGSKKGTALVKSLPEFIQDELSKLLKVEAFSGKSNEVQVAYPGSTKDAGRLLFVGVGDVKKLTAEALRRAAGKVAQELVKLKVKTVGVIPPSIPKKTQQAAFSTALAEGFILGAYEFKQYKTKKNSDKGDSSSHSTLEVTLLDAEKQLDEHAVEKGVFCAGGVSFARDLGNTPANELTPQILAKKAKQLASETKLKCTILTEEDMEKIGMHMLLGVSKGSNEPAQMIILEHRVKGSKETVAIVGKGITFDSGGISLKPGKGMDEMKFDMCGGAAVLGAMKAVAGIKPNVNVIGVVPASENLPNGRAQKPGDIVTSLSGQTVEVLNTDAEGRLILGDALTYVEQTYSPNAIIDLATLTGACVTALGRYASAAIGNDDKLLEEVIAAGKASGDLAWPLPNFPEYEDCLKGKYADIKNLGDGTAGTITAGLFLKKFVEKTPWTHLDIAGTAWNVRNIGYIPNDGATGSGVRLLVEFLSQHQSSFDAWVATCANVLAMLFDLIEFVTSFWLGDLIGIDLGYHVHASV